jgi:hypothetical protein
MKTSKTAFVLSLPSTMSAVDVISKAKEKGMKLTKGYVYEIRSAAKRKARIGVKRARPSLARPSIAVLSATKKPNGTSSENAFRRIVVDIGVSRSRALLADVERRFAEIVGK